jgi:HPt (histidine-containing phosphotransfer) domain-containing protein
MEFHFFLGDQSMNPSARPSIRIQILAAKEPESTAGRAVATARERLTTVAGIGRAQGAQALLVCPAPEEFVEDGIDLVIAARFEQEFDEDALFSRQLDLSNELSDALRVEAIVLDLDRPLDRFLSYIEPLLASPYRDEIGRFGDGITRI